MPVLAPCSEMLSWRQADLLMLCSSSHPQAGEGNSLQSLLIYLHSPEAMGCHISTSALYTKRGSQTWSLRLHPSHLIYLSFTSVEDHKKPSELRASCRSVGTTGLVARAPKHFMSHGTRQEVKAVTRKFSPSSENTGMLPHPHEPV